MKVFGLTTTINGRTRRIIVATTSQAKAVAALHEVGLRNISLSFFRDYAGPTANEAELEVALAEPGVVFVSRDMGRPKVEDYERMRS